VNKCSNKPHARFSVHTTSRTTGTSRRRGLRGTATPRDAVSFLRDLRRVPCADCGDTFAPYVMEFDHKQPGTKSFGFSAAGSVSRDRLLTELSKCEVVCANCHRARTYARAIERREARLRDGHEPRRESRLRREQTALIRRSASVRVWIADADSRSYRDGFRPSCSRGEGASKSRGCWVVLPPKLAR